MLHYLNLTLRHYKTLYNIKSMMGDSSKEIADPQVCLYYLCPHHPREAINRVCLDKQCHDRRAMCNVCCQIQHKGHQIVPLITLMKESKECAENIYDNPEEKEKYTRKCTEYLKRVRLLRQQTCLAFDEVQIRLNECLHSCEMFVDQDFDSLRRALQVIRLFCQGPQKKGNNQLLESSRKLVKGFFDLKFISATLQKKGKRSYCQALNQEFAPHLQSLQKIKTRAMNFYKQFQSKQKVRLMSVISQWSETNRHADLQIKGPIICRVGQSQTQAFACGLIDKQLSLSPPNNFRFRFRIESLMDQIGLGICREALVKASGWSAPTFQTSGGHGYFVNMSSGIVYHSKNFVMNYTNKGVKMQEGDVIDLEFDNYDGVLTIRKNGRQKTEFEIDNCPAGDVFKPCVLLREVGDSVEILKV